MAERDDAQAFYDALVRHGLVVPTPVQGAWARGPQFEDIVERFDALVMRMTQADGAERLAFPPIVGRSLIERVGYLDSFPHLAGSIHSFVGDEASARELSQRVHSGLAWDDMLEPTESMLAPAACYPVYPLFSGLLPAGGRLVTVVSWVYRREPSADPTRLQAFRMREFVRAGAQDEVLDWRDAWVERGLSLMASLGVPAASQVASDPFFGRTGKFLASNQRDKRLKFELLVPITSAQQPTAVCSFNWHQDHFSGAFGIRGADGSTASTACLGFGLERVALALLRHHGFDSAQWPAAVRKLLWP